MTLLGLSLRVTNYQGQIVKRKIHTFCFKFSYKLGSHRHGNIGQETGEELLAKSHPVVSRSNEEVGDVCKEVQKASDSCCHVGYR